MNVYADVGTDEMKLASLKVAELLFVETDARQSAIRLSHRKDGGRYRIRTYDFHRVKMALYR